MNQYSQPSDPVTVPTGTVVQEYSSEYLIELISRLEEQIQRQSRRINRLESTLSEVNNHIRSSNVK